jgi:hypothetical protein
MATVVAAVRVARPRRAAAGIVRALLLRLRVHRLELLREDDFRAPEDFRDAVLRAPEVFFAVDLRAPEDFLEADLRAVDFFDADLRVLDDDFLAPDDFFEADLRPPADFFEADFFDADVRAPDFFAALFFRAPPPVCLLTVAQARLSAVFFDTPRFS